MRVTVFTTAIILTAVALTGTAVLAKSGDRGARMTFEQFDANGDGEVSRAEAEAARDARFAQIDSDGDGFVTLEDLTGRATERAQERATRMMERLDADGDGRLSQDELAQGPRSGRMFDRLDQNGDGVISKPEFDAARDRMGKGHGPKPASE